jgi:hypothetical protein
MAQRITTLLLDDIDGSEAEETVAFGLDGVPYEIDLNTANAAALRKSLAKYVDHARKVTGSARVGRGAVGRGGRPVVGSGRVRKAADALDTNKIREWAKANGHNIKDRGRVPGNIVAEYERATGN